MRTLLLAILSAIMLVLSLQVTSSAATRYVVPSLSSCPTLTAGYCFTNVSDAISNAVTGDAIEVRPGTYQGQFSLTSKNLNIYGIETATTILDGLNAALPVLTLNNVAGTSIRNLTFTNAAVGIEILNSSAVQINNTIIEAGASNIGVRTRASTGSKILNNTFFLNANGVVLDTADQTTASIVNNIFFQSGSATAITSGTALGIIKNNLFFGGTVGPLVVTTPGIDYLGNIIQDPTFAKNNSGLTVAQRDFHLAAGSPAINAGDISVTGTNIVGDTSKTDIGAYGGAFSDKVPTPISDLSSSVSGSQITLTWSPNNCYLVAGYNVYLTSSATPTDAGLITTYTFTRSSVVSAPTGTPALFNTFSDSTLVLFWGAGSVSGATGYEVRYGTASPPLTAVDAGATITYPLSGLENGTYYYVSVVPYAQDSLSMTVTAYYTGKTAESAKSNAVSAVVGGKIYGAPSNEIYDTPEPIIAQPNLPNTGCFIATAAYGSYSAPEVILLRRFRDAYLMSSGPGRAFVDWYYRNGPRAAAFVNDHPWMKSLVRLALLPALGVAAFLLQTSLIVKAAILLGSLFLFFPLLRRRKTSPSGGAL